ncbi:MAG: hypothetical protein EF812_04475 [Methanosarcinales archaeon]|nr:MAG: hypothetical protein EF812_04475 [Methanosarcinales archaeon]
MRGYNPLNIPFEKVEEKEGTLEFRVAKGNLMDTSLENVLFFDIQVWDSRFALHRGCPLIHYQHGHLKLYIQLADELISYQENADLQEARLRSAMSRCYYGIFCITRNQNQLVAKGIFIPKVNTHKFVREKYKGSAHKVKKKIGKNLGRLWKERKDADYENDTDINVSRAKSALDLSERTLEKLRQMETV